MLIHRGVEALLLFALVVTLTFLLVRAAPGDAADLLVSPTATPAEAARLRHDLGLDASGAVQYAHWVGGVLRGDLGESFTQREPVVRLLARALPVSAGLGLASLALTFALGVAVGSWQAARRGQWADHLVGVASVTVFAAPSYWLALGLVALCTTGAAWWGAPAWARLPSFGLRSPGAFAGGWPAVLDMARHAVLPVTVLAAIGAAGMARYARAIALELQGEAWVRTAHAKGARERTVRWRHVLANAAPPLVVLLALSIPGVVAGSVFVESIFAWPGMGRLMLGAIAARDHPVVLGATLVYAAVVLAANVAADVVVAWLDPRRR